MTGEERRKAIIEIISKSTKPVSGTALAKQFQVSRQVIVQDIALLRAADYDIYSAARGYMLMPSLSENKNKEVSKDTDAITRVFHVSHTDEQMEDELNTIVDMGGRVLDVYVEHAVYGAIRTALPIACRRHVQEFMSSIHSGKSTPLKNLTSMTVLWKIIFSGDQMGYLNSWLMKLGVIDAPIIWLLDSRYLLPIIIIVALWSSMGVGFLAMLAGILNADEELYEAAAIDGVKNRFQEMIYITIPTMKPQMLFGAVMAIVGAFQNGAIGVQLSGTNPTPNYAGQLIVNHIEDYGFLRYEMGYAAAVSVVLLLMVYAFSKFFGKMFRED